MSGASFRLSRLSDNNIEQLEISRRTGINGARVSLELRSEKPLNTVNRERMYNFLKNRIKPVMTFQDFWCKSIRLKKV